MLNIDRHIEILLLDNDCVFVPGLGGFIAHYVEAQYDESTDSFLPPLRTLGFNAKLNINDFLLAQSYIECYDISYPEALRRIEEEVAELNAILHAKGRCELNDLGVLFINDEGNVEFQPCEAGILTPELYGFGALEGLSVDGKSQTEAAEDNADKRTDDIYIGGEAVADDNTQHEENEDEPALTIRLSTLRYVAATAAAVLLLFMVSQPLGNSEYYESAVDAGALYHILPKDVKQPTAAAPTHDIEIPATEKAGEDAPVDNAKVKEAPVVKEEQQKKVAAPRYVIVVASRITQENAVAYASQLTKEGIPSEAVLRQNGSKVVCGNYDSEDSARSHLRNLRSSDTRFEEAWVMQLK